MLEADQRQAWMRSRRNKRKTARHARVRQFLLRYFLMVLLVGTGIYFLANSSWRLGNLDKDIIVRGNNYSGTAQIKKSLAAYLNRPVFEIDPKNVEKDVEKLESIKFAFVRRYIFPRPKLVVIVKEEFPWASLSNDPEREPAYIVAESGRMIPVKKFPSYPRPPMVISADFNKAKKMFSPEEVKQWATWIGYIENQAGEKVQLVDLRRQYDVRVKTDKTLFRLGIPDTTLATRLGRISSIMETVAAYRDQLEYVDLALDNNIPLKLSKLVKDKKVATKTAAAAAHPQISEISEVENKPL